MCKKVLITLIAFLSLLVAAKAQDVTSFNLYNQNQLLYNPAFNVHDDNIVAYANSNLRWLNVPGSPKNEKFGIAYSKNPTMGFGLSVNNNSQGLFNYFNANLQYAYKLKFGEDNYLRMGLSLGIVNDKLNAANAQNIDLSDQTLAEGYYDKTTVTTGFGLAYTYKNFDAQLILPQIYDHQIFKLQTILILGYNYQANEQLDLYPSVMVRRAVDIPLTFDANIQATWKKKLWTQVSFRTNKSMVISLGAIIKKYSIGYAYEYNIGELSAVNYGTHELQMVYRMGKIERPKKRPFTGKIINSVNNKPIAADIKIYNNNGLIEEIKSDSTTGEFSVKLLEGNTYNIEVNANSYFPVNQNIEIAKDTLGVNKEIKLTPKNIELSGVVTDKITNKPVDAKITVLSGNKIVKVTNTDRAGKYSVEVERNANYTIKVEAENHRQASKSVNTNTYAQSITGDFELQPIITIMGKVTDNKTGQGIGAKLEFADNKTGRLIKTVVTNSSTGEYKVELTGLKSVSLTVTSTGYMFYTDNIVINNPDQKIVKDIALQKVEKGVNIVLENVVFDAGKTTLKEQSIPEIERVIAVMQANPDIKIELSGHTDNTGSYRANKLLSKKRAQAVADYMISKGISPDRIIVVGYGPDKPRASNKTEEGRELNRRVEATIISE